MLTDEVVNASDVCHGCLRIYQTPAKRDPKTDTWAWRRCPTSDCRLHGRTVRYPGEWEAAARARILQLEAALRVVVDVADGLHEHSSRSAILVLIASALNDPSDGACSACEKKPVGKDGRAAFCTAHREGGRR